MCHVDSTHDVKCVLYTPSCLLVRAYHMGVYILVREREQELGLRYGFGSDKKGAVHTKMITRGQNHIRGYNHTHISKRSSCLGPSSRVSNGPRMEPHLGSNHLGTLTTMRDDANAKQSAWP